MGMKPAGSSTWKIWDSSPDVGRTLRPSAHSLILPTCTSSPTPAGLPGTLPHLAQTCILAMPSGPGGKGDAHVCSGPMGWLVPSPLGSKSLGIILSAPMGRAEGLGRDPSFQGNYLTKMAHWKDLPPAFSWQGCGQVEECPARPALPRPMEPDPGISGT